MLRLMLQSLTYRLWNPRYKARPATHTRSWEENPAVMLPSNVPSSLRKRVYDHFGEDLMARKDWPQVARHYLAQLPPRMTTI